MDNWCIALGVLHCMLGLLVVELVLVRKLVSLAVLEGK